MRKRGNKKSLKNIFLSVYVLALFIANSSVNPSLLYAEDEIETIEETIVEEETPEIIANDEQTEIETIDVEPTPEVVEEETTPFEPEEEVTPEPTPTEEVMIEETPEPTPEETIEPEVEETPEPTPEVIEEEVVEEEEPVEEETEEVLYPSFKEEKTIDDIIVTVEAPEGVFPEESTLYVEKVPTYVEQQVSDAIDQVREEEKNVVVSYTFDIKVLNNGEEVQPKDSNTVKVSFRMKEVLNENLSTDVYHIDDKQEEITSDQVTALETTTEEDIAVVETDGFSLYTVEFTYNNKQYVLEGDSYAKLSEILETVALTGEVSDWEISNTELFNIYLGQEDSPRFMMVYESDGTPIYRDEEDPNYGKVLVPYIVTNDPNGNTPWVAALQPFTSEEWLDVTMDDGVTYRIVVTDSIIDGSGEKDDIPGIAQGENLTNFAPMIPVADIWVDSSKFYAAGNHVNGDFTEFVPGPLLTAENSPFKEEIYATDTKSKASEYEGKHFVYYDSTVKPLDGTIETTRTGSTTPVYQSYNYFDGVLGTYKWTDAAVRMLEDGTEEKLDLYIEYSNPMISLQSSAYTDPADVNSWDDVYVGLFGGNAVTTGCKDVDGNGLSQRYALQLEAKPYVKDKDGNIVNAKIYFPMVDLDVNRSGTNFSRFYGADDTLANYDPTLNCYSEGARVKEGLVLNSNEDQLYIPGGDGNYKSIVSRDDEGYFRITGKSSDVDPGTFYSGFLALIQNGEFKVSVTQASGISKGSVITYVMAGSEYNYRLRHSTQTLKQDGSYEEDGTVGGTIQTTREGNHNGELNDGQVIDPTMIATAVGQSIVYTFTPKPGYILKDVYVWNGAEGETTLDFPSIDSMSSKTKIEEGDGTGDTYIAHDDNGDGIIDRYTYTFTGINEDNAIHVIWASTALDIRKTVTGSGAEEDTFTFTIKAWGDEEGSTEYVNFKDAAKMGDLASKFTDLGNGSYLFTLKSSETLSIPPGVIPFGYQYEVEEIEIGGKYGTLDGWTPVGSTVKGGELTEENPSGKATFTNKRKKPVGDDVITVKKVWENDAPIIRPKNIDIYIRKNIPSAIYSNTSNTATGTNMFVTNYIQPFFSNNLNTAKSTMTAFKYGTKEQAEAAAATRREINLYKGDQPIYIWREGTEIFIYSDTDIYFIGSMASMFNGFTKLEDISGLEHIHTDFVTSTHRMFLGCTALENDDLAALKDWNTVSVTNMAYMFANSTATTAANRMKISNLENLSNWETGNVTDMKYMFSGTQVDDLSYLSSWDVSRVTSMQYMFNNTNAASVNQNEGVGGRPSIAETWDPASMLTASSSWGYMFRYANNGAILNNNVLSNLPQFAERSGTWVTAGTYTQVGAGHTPGPAPEMPYEDDVFGEPETKHEKNHDVDDDGNWIYEFDVTEDSTWDVWEVLPENYEDYYEISNVTIEQPDGEIIDFGSDAGTENSPAKGAKSGSTTTITNTRKLHKLKIEKEAQPTTDEAFTFTLNLYSVNVSNPYDLPDDYPQIVDGTLTKVGAGLYEFTLTPSADDPVSIELELPVGIRYSVVESPVDGWTLMSEENTTGLLNADKTAKFVNKENDTLKVVKKWEGDSLDRLIMDSRPENEDDLGITIISQDRTKRWKKTAEPILTDIVGTVDQRAAYFAVKDLYDSSSVIPELKDYDGETNIATTAPKLVHLDEAIGTLLQPGDYVVDKVAGNEGQLTVYPVENVPFERTLTEAVKFEKDDENNEWIYEYDITARDEVLSVEETTVPGFYQKVETSTEEGGRVVYNITNTLDKRDLIVAKETVNDVEGQFEFRVTFSFTGTDGETHPYVFGSTPTGLTPETPEGRYSFTLNTNESISIPNIPIAVSYTIEELTQDGWQLQEKVNDEGKMSDGITETWIYNETEYTDKAEADAAAIAEIVDKGAGTYEYNGTTYDSIYAAQKAAKEAITKKPYDPIESTFTNKQDVNELVITKTVSGNMGDKEDQFEFKVKVSRHITDITRAKYVLKAFKVQTSEDDEGTGYYSLESTVFPFKFNGVTFNENKRLDWGDGAGGGEGTEHFTDEDWAFVYLFNEHVWNASFGNNQLIIDYDYSPSDVYTEYIGGWFYYMTDENDSTPNFAQYDESEERDDYIDLSEYGGTDNGDGSYTFTLGHGETLSIPNIPYGYTYEVIEKDYSDVGYTTKVNGVEGREASGEFAGEDITLEYENIRGGVIPTKAFGGIVAPFAILALLGIGWFFLKYRRREELE